MQMPNSDLMLFKNWNPALVNVTLKLFLEKELNVFVSKYMKYYQEYTKRFLYV